MNLTNSHMIYQILKYLNLSNEKVNIRNTHPRGQRFWRDIKDLSSTMDISTTYQSLGSWSTSRRYVVSGLQAVCHVRIMRRWSSNLEQWTIQHPRLWVPNPYSLSPTRRSKPAFQWQGTNERIHRQWQYGTKRNQDRHGGHQFTYGSSVTSLVTGGTVFFSEQPGETFTQQRGNSLLRVSLNITIFLSKSFSGFRNRGPEPVTPSMLNTKVFRSDH